MRSAKPAFGEKAWKNSSPLKSRRWNKAGFPQSLLSLWKNQNATDAAKSHVRLPGCPLNSRRLPRGHPAPQSHLIHRSSFQHDCPRSCSFAPTAEQTRRSRDIYHVASFTRSTPGYYIVPRASERSLLSHDGEAFCHRELLDSPPSPRKGKRKGKKMFHRASCFIWGRQSRWTRLSSTCTQFSSLFSSFWL